MLIDTGTFELPSSDTDRKKLQSAIKEASDILTIIEGYKSSNNEIKKSMKEQFNVPPKVFNALVKAYHKQEIDKMRHENDVVSETYEILFEKISSNE